MRNPALKKIGKRVLQIGLPIVILVVFLPKLLDSWKLMSSHSFQWNPWLVALAFLGFVLQELSFGLIWRFVLDRLGARLSFRNSLRIYLASEFVRYIPGNVWHVVTRILWAGRCGVQRPIAFASMTIELVTKLVAGALVFAASMLFWQDIGAIGKYVPGPVFVGLGALSIIALLTMLHPKILGGLLNIGLKLVKKDPIVLTMQYRDILLVTLAWCLSWIVAGVAFYVLLLSIWPSTPLIALPICIGIYAIGWDIGFVFLITPGGLGFREAAIAALFVLALPIPGEIAAVIAIFSRVVSTLAEFICVGVAYVSGGQEQVKAVQQEQETLQAQGKANGEPIARSNDKTNVAMDVEQSVDTGSGGAVLRGGSGD